MLCTRVGCFSYSVGVRGARLTAFFNSMRRVFNYSLSQLRLVYADVSVLSGDRH